LRIWLATSRSHRLSIYKTRVQSALDDVASNVRQGVHLRDEGSKCVG